jgi:hypothetical protein
MAMVQSNATQANEPVLDRAFIEQERNRFASRALSFLVLLNGAGALILLMVMAQAPAATVHGKVAAAMLFFSVGAIAALLSAFLAYINRTIKLEQPGRRENLRAALRGFAIAAVIGSGAAFLTGMNMVATAQVEKSSWHSKGPREDNRLKSSPSEKGAAEPAEAPAADEPAAERAAPAEAPAAQEPEAMIEEGTTEEVIVVPPTVSEDAPSEPHQGEPASPNQPQPVYPEGKPEKHNNSKEARASLYPWN